MGEKSREKKERREGGQSDELAGKPVGSQNSILWWIIFIGTCLISFIPFIVGLKYFFPFVGPKSIYFMAIVEIIFAAWLVLMISAPKYRPKLNAVLLSLILFLSVFVISSVLGVDFSRSFWSKYERMTGVLMQLHLFAFFLVVSSTFKRKEDWLKIFGVFAFAAVLMSAISLAPKIGWNVLGKIEESSRGGATLGNSSFLGTYLLFNFFLAIYLFFNTNKTFKILIGIAIAVIGIALYLSTAQAALLSTLAGLALLFLLWLAFTRKGSLKLIGMLILTVTVLAVIIFAYFAMQKDSFAQKMIFDRVGATFGGRFVVWQGAWKAFLEKPFFGWGPENFEILFTRYFNPCMLGVGCGADVWYDRAHNIVIDTLSATGVMGMISYLGIFIAAFYVLWKKFFRSEIGFWATGVFSVVLISYFIQNLTVFDMINSYMMFFLILGFVGNISSDGEDQNNDKTEKPINFSYAAVICVFLLLSLSVCVLKPLKANGYIIQALGYPIGSTERLEFFQKSLETSPIGKYQIRDYFAQSDLEILPTQDLSKLSVEGIKKEMAFVAGEMVKSTNESPMDFRSYLKLGQVYNMNAVLKNDAADLYLAEKTLNKAIELSPTNQQGYWTLAQTELYLNKGQEAVAEAEKAKALDPRSIQSNTILIQIAKILGDNALAQKKFEEAIAIDPSWATSLKSVLDR
jgi:O-antigen ligase